METTSLHGKHYEGRDALLLWSHAISSVSSSVSDAVFVLILPSVPPPTPLTTLSTPLPAVPSSFIPAQGRSECCRCFWHWLLWWGRHQGHQGKTSRCSYATLFFLNCQLRWWPCVEGSSLGFRLTLWTEVCSRSITAASRHRLLFRVDR